MTQYISIGNAAQIIGVCTKTLYRWEKEKYLAPAFRTKGGHRRYKRGDIIAYIRNRNHSSPSEQYVNAAIYARVSAQKQKQDLQRQVECLQEYCTQKKYHVTKIFTDIGSGLNDGRKSLHKMLEDATLGKFDIVVVNFNDRLARFGIKIIEAYLNSWDIEVDVHHRTIVDEQDDNATLITDMVAILYSFMGKLYRKRKGTNTKKDIKMADSIRFDETNSKKKVTL